MSVARDTTSGPYGRADCGRHGPSGWRATAKIVAAACGGAWLLAAPWAAAAPPSPNVLIVMTDDQGYGDLGCHGNPVIRTPRIDRFAAQSVRLAQFYVAPVCSPTRASLLTGRYHLRTGVVDTYLGRSLMHGDEITLAERLAGAGYRTGIFGKWHLGDHLPLRPQEQGFAEVLVHGGGGIGQPSDPPGGNHYQDPWLVRDGRPYQARGYVTDVLTEAAAAFIAAEPQRPWFCYLAYNCPHTPLEVPPDALAEYDDAPLEPQTFAGPGQPLPARLDRQAIAKVYAMVTRIDQQFGRLLDRLDALHLADNTLVVFLTDNGPQQPRYNAGLRGLKGSVYEGGIRVPCYVRWPARLSGGREVREPAAHIDLVPTILAACGLSAAEGLPLDGVDLLPLLTGHGERLAARPLFFQWHRGDAPQQYRACAVRFGGYKLVQPAGGGDRPLPSSPPWELYAIDDDPYELHDLAAERPEVVARLRAAYDDWFADVARPRGYDPPRIYLGDRRENPLVLTRQDWRGPRAGWTPESQGHWEVTFVAGGPYEIAARFEPPARGGQAVFECGGVRVAQAVEPQTAEIVFRVELPQGDARLSVSLADGRANAPRGPGYVAVRARP